MKTVYKRKRKYDKDKKQEGMEGKTFSFFNQRRERSRAYVKNRFNALLR